MKGKSSKVEPSHVGWKQATVCTLLLGSGKWLSALLSLSTNRQCALLSRIGNKLGVLPPGSSNRQGALPQGSGNRPSSLPLGISNMLLTGFIKTYGI